jgi:cytochrome bd-type quinol oxidase subunit 1
MNWPPIDVPVLGRSGLIALITLLHIPFFVNFVMGAPVIAVVAEWMGRRTGDSRYDRLSKDLSMMALVTVGVGALGGVAIVVANIGLFPRFFSVGAGIFFWPLAVEILAFATEAIFIAVYRYTWDRMKHRPLHMLFGLLGAFGAWVSGLIINALASFMLTPGKWPETRNIWDAVFNPTFIPSYLHRGLAALSVTGFFLIVYSLWVARREPADSEDSYPIWSLRHAGKWALAATALQFLPGVWYLIAIEQGTSLAAPEGSVVPKLLGGPLTFYWFGGIILAATAIVLVWFLALQNPKSGLTRLGKLALIVSVLCILTAGAFMGFTRERARKPYLVYGVMYGNELMADFPHGRTVDAVDESSADRPLGGADEQALALYTTYRCSGCHALDGEGGGIPLGGIGARMSVDDIQHIIANPPKGMPAFGGTAEELATLSAFLAAQK